MNKQDLVAAVADARRARRAATRSAQSMRCSKRDDGRAEGGDDVKLVGFGTFHVARREASSGRNPRTGEPMALDARNQPKFTAGKGVARRGQLSLI